MTIEETKLDPHLRGNPFIYNFVVDDLYDPADFESVVWVLRLSVPESTVVTDEGEGVVDTASTDDAEITFTGQAGRVEIPSPRVNVWPSGKLVWALRAYLDADNFFDLAFGTILIVGTAARAAVVPEP